MSLYISKDIDIKYYSGPERRLAKQPRRHSLDRRHRLRTESLISDCRSDYSRRAEDDDGYVNIASLYADLDQPHTRK